jgi:peroxiredoxin Q/BCP
VKPIFLPALAVVCLGAAPPSLAAQGPTPLAVGDSAPDFALPAATRDGILPLPARLRDFRGQTVVLAFFYKARTGG